MTFPAARTPPFTLTITTIDSDEPRYARYRKLDNARARAQREVGDHPTIGHGYAVSQDGITKIEVDGTTIGDLFDGPTTDNDFRRTADGQIFPRTDRGLAELRALHDEQCRRDAETAYDARDY